jgi:hypothetical protein
MLRVATENVPWIKVQNAYSAIVRDGQSSVLAEQE